MATGSRVSEELIKREPQNHEWRNCSSHALTLNTRRVYSDKSRRSLPEKHTQIVRKFFNLELCIAKIRTQPRQRFLGVYVTTQARADVAGMLQMTTFVHEWANISLTYKSMQRRIGPDKNDNRSLGGARAGVIVVNRTLAWRLLSSGVST
jgi:hypothetical protein